MPMWGAAREPRTLAAGGGDGTTSAGIEVPSATWAGTRASAGITVAFLALAALLAGVATGSGMAELRSELAATAGALSIVALLAASVRVRAHPAPSWTTSRHDPFLAFAGALSLLAVAAVFDTAARTGAESPTDGYGWLVGCTASVLGALGFLIMIRDLAPNRAVDALYLAGIGALATGLVSWFVTHDVIDARSVGTGRMLALLAPAVLDLVVVGLGVQALALRARARGSSWFLVLAWTVLFAVEVSTFITEMGGPTAPGPMVGAAILGFALLGAAALHPSATLAVEPALGPAEQMPRSQIVLLVGAVLAGPAVLAVRVDDPATRGVVLALSAALSLLVVVHLVRLVQGRAIFEHRAHHDELTGLANRTLFGDRAAQAIAYNRRTQGHSAVLFLDLDRFKNVNDSLGHAVGNLLLQAVAKRLRACTRAEDTVARFGGDEFVVFLPQIDEPVEATVVASTILHRFGEPFSLNGHRLFASPSIGIAVFPTDGADADSLLKNADTAMYQAKQRGRRTFCMYDRSMNDHAHERLALESRLHSAIERGELRLHYQPKIHLATGRVMGMEALLRWQHPDLGLIEPAEFIPLAEESGLIVPLGEWALQEACRQNQAWAKAGFGGLVVAVNLSSRQFQQQHIEDVTARILRTTGLDPSLLELEVTESLALQDPGDVRTTLLDLRAMGVKCSIDDFGTGYSGLSHLMQLPIDKLKIDKSFVATIDSDREAPIVVAVVALAHGLGLEVVAEGVETAEQLKRLRELGCDEMQGYLFSRPLPPERFEQLLMLESISPGPGRLVVVEPASDRQLHVVG